MLKELGEHPAEGGKMQVLDGQVRPLREARQGQRHAAEVEGPGDVTMDEAVALIAERVAKGGGKKPKRGAAKAKPKAKAEAAEGEEKPVKAKKAAVKKSAPKSKKATKRTRPRRRPSIGACAGRPSGATRDSNDHPALCTCCRGLCDVFPRASGAGMTLVKIALTSTVH